MPTVRPVSKQLPVPGLPNAVSESLSEGESNLSRGNRVRPRVSNVGAYLLTCFLLHPFLAGQTNIFEFYIRSGEGKTANFRSTTNVKIVTLVARHFLLQPCLYAPIYNTPPKLTRADSA